MYNRRKGFTPALLVTTKKSTSNGHFYCMTPPMDTAEIGSVRPALEVTNITTDVNVQVAWQLSDDAEIWPATTATPGFFACGTIGARTSEGISYATAFEDMAANLTKKFARFGVWVKNDAGSALETCVAAIRIERKKS
jgi:hypothetical protein